MNVRRVVGSAWECRVCIAQFFGGPRCFEHNPTPEERERRRAELTPQPVQEQEEEPAF